MIETKDLFQKSDLIPVIIQHWQTRQVLMLGFTNAEAYELTLKTHTAWFWSRSRQKLWNKGESSGNYLHVKKMITDCDTDTLLYLCAPDGPSGPLRSSTQWPWTAGKTAGAKNPIPATFTGRVWTKS